MYKNRILFCLQILQFHITVICVQLYRYGNFLENIFPPYISICLLAISGDHIRGMLPQTDKQSMTADKKPGSEKKHKSDALQLVRINFFL